MLQETNPQIMVLPSKGFSQIFLNQNALISLKWAVEGNINQIEKKSEHLKALETSEHLQALKTIEQALKDEAGIKNAYFVADIYRTAIELLLEQLAEERENIVDQNSITVEYDIKWLDEKIKVAKHLLTLHQL